MPCCRRTCSCCCASGGAKGGSRVMLPTAGCFPGSSAHEADQHAAALSRRRRGGRRRRASQARRAAHAAPQLRHAPAGGRHRHPRHPGPARARQARTTALYTKVATRTIRAVTSPLDGSAASSRQRRPTAEPCAPHSRSPTSSVLPGPRTGPPCRASEPAPAQGHVGDRALPHRCLGGHVEACEDCGHWRIAYNSCRNRHCPKCQGAAARTWLAEREADLLPVGYFHVVFTLPAEVADIAFHNKALVYDLLFKAASETMLTIAADPKHLGARIGITAVLHTWGSALTHHPHVHMIVPGGGIAPMGPAGYRHARPSCCRCACSASCSAACS
jgi:hypothetical protein